MKNLLTIFFTSDTHGYLYPTSFAQREEQPMGLMRMRFPKDGNTLVIDGGDSIQGSPLTYYCRTQGEAIPVAQVMNRLGCDYVTLGNHDFNNGYDDLKAYLDALDARCLCANVRDDLGGMPVTPCAVHTLANGLRVGLVGIVTDWVNLWEKPEHLTHLHVTDPVPAARDAIASIEGQYDVLVGIYHGGIERDLASGRLLSGTTENIACRICEELPFDLLLTGHQHIALPSGSWHGTHLVQPPAFARQYVKITMDESRAFRSELCTPEAPADITPEEAALYARLNRWLDTPIGHLSRPLLPAEKLAMALHGNDIADFFNLVQLEASGAELSCTALGNEVKGFDREVTVRDVVSSYVYTNTLTVLEVTGEDLRLSLEQCARYFAVEDGGRVRIADHFLQPKISHYNYDYFMGVEYVFDLNRPEGQRVVSLTRNQKPVAAGDRFTLVMNNYRATGAGDFDAWPKCRVVREIQRDVSELILEYFRAHPRVDLPEKRWFRVIMPA